MVDALREAWRVLTPDGVLIDVRPVTEPIIVEVVAGTQAVWAKTVHMYSAPQDAAAADAAMRYAVSSEWFAFQTSLTFDFEIYCENAAEWSAYAESRQLSGVAIPNEELEERRRDYSADGQPAVLRCRRPWKLTTYRKK